MGAWDRHAIGRAECWVGFDRMPTKSRPRQDPRHGFRVYTPDATIKAEKHIRDEWERQVGKDWQDFEGEVRVRISIERPLSKSNPKGWRGRADLSKPDVDNVAKLCLDALSGHKSRGEWVPGIALKDDSTITALSVVRVPRMPYREGQQCWIRIRIDYYEEDYVK